MIHRSRVIVPALLVLLVGLPLRGALATDPTLVDVDAVTRLVPVPAVGPGNVQPLGRSIDVPPGDFAAYGTGTVVHVDALTPPDGESLLGVDVAFSGSAFSSAKPTGRYANEMGRFVVPDLPAKGGHGRGDGLELGIAAPPTPLIGELADATAPPSTGLVEKVINLLDLAPVVTLDLLRGQAQARSVADGCVLGSNLGYGLGSVLNLELLDGLLSTTALPPLREVSQSTSRTAIVPGTSAGRLGLMSETRQTVAPVTLFKGTDNQFTIEVLGEWVLRAVADGVKSTIQYGPGEENPETPVLRVLDKNGKELGSLSTQDLLGDEGLVIEVPGVALVAVGEDPREIDGAADTKPVLEPTRALAAVDVVRVQLLDGVLADVRIGHMEAAVAVPSAGVRCPGITVDHTVEPDDVKRDEEFTYTVTITNPNDCTLTGVQVVETITTPTGVVVAIVSGGDERTDASVTWKDIGPLGPNETKVLKAVLRAKPGSLSGRLKSDAVATGVCDSPDTGPDAGLDIPVEGSDAVEGPQVTVDCVLNDLTGLTLAEAMAKLEAAGCKLGDITQDPNSDPADHGTVTDQTPDPGTHPPGTVVDLVVGGPVCAVPDLAGLSQAEAERTLERAGCKLGDVTEAPPGPGEPGRITDQTPEGGTVTLQGTQIDVTILGPACDIPDLSGLDEAAAGARVRAEGCTLTSSTRLENNPDRLGKVVDQNPDSGTKLPPGSPVAVILGVLPSGGGIRDAHIPKAVAPPAGTLPRTGGIALVGLASMLLAAGVILRLVNPRHRS